MEAQRLRNLTTGRLHTKIGHVYEDLGFITGMEGLMIYMLPNLMRAVEPWPKEHVTESRYWDGEFDQDHAGEESIRPMSENERQEMLERYRALPNPLTLIGKDVVVVKT